MISAMALAISPPTPSLLQSSTPYIGKKPSVCILSNPSILVPKHAPQLGFAPFSQWIYGRKHPGTISIPKFSAKMRRKGRGKHNRAYASLFGVGAPEVLVIGVVALLVFGPKGLAEAARSLGKTIRAFQPTIKELQEVSREFKSSLEREIGLDETDNPASKRIDSPKPTSEEYGTNVEPSESPRDRPASETGAYTADEYLKVTEAQLKGALARMQQEQVQPQTPSEETPQDADDLQVPPKPKSET